MFLDTKLLTASRLLRSLLQFGLMVLRGQLRERVGSRRDY